ncbi:hypothetical protein AG1IA_05030 [Rhizoctonia solani AG-1 IA]|uniref:Uncharacterized protein n=1 Tax=Thanatephorus cucumeris (strain AG1-IA) TaxID=983506 RepID=L8WSI3_THACA|nr:hypothetical protein AG1IA_05030 [Rhizoctonia solani AG-1 IA]
MRGKMVLRSELEDWINIMLTVLARCPFSMSLLATTRKPASIEIASGGTFERGGSNEQQNMVKHQDNLYISANTYSYQMSFPLVPASYWSSREFANIQQCRVFVSKALNNHLRELTKECGLSGPKPSEFIKDGTKYFESIQASNSI